MLSGSMTAGGRLLSVSQPAITRLIRDLEAELRLTLFLREGTQITPTREARELYREVERHFISTERIRDAAVAIREYNAGQIRVAAILALSSSCIPRALAEFSESYPNIVVSVHSGLSFDIIDLVTNGSMDVGFVAMPPNRKDLDFEDLVPAEAVCVLPIGHRLAGREVIEPADLHEQDFIALGPNSLMRLELNALLQLAGSHPKVKVETLFSSTVVSCVNRGMGMAIVDPLATVHVDPQRAVVRKFRPSIRYALSAVYPPHTKRPALIEDFVNVVRRAYISEVGAHGRSSSRDASVIPS